MRLLAIGITALVLGCAPANLRVDAGQILNGPAFIGWCGRVVIAFDVVDGELVVYRPHEMPALERRIQGGFYAIEIDEQLGHDCPRGEAI